MTNTTNVDPKKSEFEINIMGWVFEEKKIVDKTEATVENPEKRAEKYGDVVVPAYDGKDREGPAKAEKDRG